MKLSILIGAIIFISANLAFAEEVDSFNGWFTPIKDSTDEINKFVNDEIQSAVDKYNYLFQASVDQCYPNEITNYTYNKIGGNPWGKAELMAENNPNIERQKINFADSIFADFSLLQAPVQVLGIGCCSAVLNVNGTRIGTDKLGHFFGQGKTYFNLVNGQIDPANLFTYGKVLFKYGPTIEAALIWGVSVEYGFYGWPNGVSSYGDLAANYSGLLFWLNLTGSSNPMLTCQKGKYSLSRKFEIKEYVDDAWDEAINCSEYRNSKLEEKVQNRIELLNRRDSHLDKGHRKYNCPIKRGTCKTLVEKYKDISEYILGPKCLVDGEYYNRQFNAQ